MARITSELALVEYIKSQLGAPTINIEVTTKQMQEIISDTVQKFSEYAYGTLEGTVIVQLSGAKEYPMPPAMTNLIRLSKGNVSGSGFNANFGAGYVPDLWSEQFFSNTLTGDIIPRIISISSTKSILDKYLDSEVVHNFNHLSKNLQVLENYNGPAVIHYQYEYLPNENNDLIYNHEWIKRYSKAKVKELWGNVTGKYSQSLVGGAQINYDRMISEAEQEIDKLDEELLTKWSDPAPIMVA